MLCHTCGFAGDFFTDTGDSTDKLARFADRCALLPLVHPPGAGFSYSNSGYAIAGRVAEVICGRAWEDLLQARVLKPLGLAQSSVHPSDLVGKSVAIGHGMNPQSGEAEPVAQSYLPASARPPVRRSPCRQAICCSSHWRISNVEANGSCRMNLSPKCGAHRSNFPYRRAAYRHWCVGWFLFRWNGP